MTLNPSNSSNLELLALKGLISNLSLISTVCILIHNPIFSSHSTCCDIFVYESVLVSSHWWHFFHLFQFFYIHVSVQSLSDLLAVPALPVLFTLARRPASSSLTITHRSYRYASLHVWNKLAFNITSCSLLIINLLHLYLLCHLHCHRPSLLIHSFILSWKHNFSKKIFSATDSHTHQPEWLHGLSCFCFSLVQRFLPCDCM